MNVIKYPNISLQRTRHPNGWVIVQDHSNFFQSYWNPGDIWAGSGHLFSTIQHAADIIERLAKETIEIDIPDP